MYDFRIGKSLKPKAEIIQSASMVETTTCAPFCGSPLPPLDLKRCVGFLTLVPLCIVVLTPLLILAWVSSRIGSQFQNNVF